jgi:hypothetical protein
MLSWIDFIETIAQDSYTLATMLEGYLMSQSIDTIRQSRRR